MAGANLPPLIRLAAPRGIAIKKLRYGSDFFENLFVGRKARKHLSRFNDRLKDLAGLPWRSQRYFRPSEVGVRDCDQAIARQEPRASFCRRHRNRQRTERNQTASCHRRRACGKIRSHPALLDVRRGLQVRLLAEPKSAL